MLRFKNAGRWLRTRRAEWILGWQRHWLLGRWRCTGACARRRPRRTPLGHLAPAWSSAHASSVVSDSSEVMAGRYALGLHICAIFLAVPAGFSSCDCGTCHLLLWCQYRRHTICCLRDQVQYWMQNPAVLGALSREGVWVHAEADATSGLNFGAYSVRLSGQDVERGTFNHRHAVLYDCKAATRCSSTLFFQLH